MSLKSKLKFVWRKRRIISPYYCTRVGINKLLKWRFNRKLSDLKSQSGLILVVYIIGKRVLKEFLDSGLSGFLSVDFLSSLLLFVLGGLVFYLYRNFNKEYEHRTSMNLENAKDLGKLPEEYTVTVEKVPFMVGCLSFIISESAAQNIHNTTVGQLFEKFGFIKPYMSVVESVMGSIIDFIFTAITFLITRSILYIILSVIGLLAYNLEGWVQFIVTTVFVGCIILYFLIELKRFGIYDIIDDVKENQSNEKMSESNSKST